MICAAVDLNGFLVATAEAYPNCSEYVLVTVAQVDRLTYWADLAIELDPTGSTFSILAGAMLTAVGVVLGLRTVVDQLRTVTKEA